MDFPALFRISLLLATGLLLTECAGPGRKTTSSQQRPGTGSASSRPGYQNLAAQGSVTASQVEYVNDGPLGVLYDFLIQRRLQRFCQLLRKANLDTILIDTGPLTLFAPTDGSFAFLPGGTLEKLERNPRLLKDFILHHFVAGDLPSSQVQNEMVVSSVQGGPLRFNIYGNVITVSGAEILEPDLQFDLGRIHIIDRPLYPIPDTDILRYLQTNHKQMYNLILSAGLAEYFSDGTYTVFVPDDKAFDYLSLDLKDALRTNSTLAYRVVLNHVIPGSVYVQGIRDGEQTGTSDGSSLTFTQRRGLTFVNSIPIVMSDIPVTNGAIHVINRVLLPEGVESDCHCKPLDGNVPPASRFQPLAPRQPYDQTRRSSHSSIGRQSSIPTTRRPSDTPSEIPPVTLAGRPAPRRQENRPLPSQRPARPISGSMPNTVNSAARPSISQTPFSNQRHNNAAGLGQNFETNLLGVNLTPDSEPQTETSFNCDSNISPNGNCQPSNRPSGHSIPFTPVSNQQIPGQLRPLSPPRTIYQRPRTPTNQIPTPSSPISHPQQNIASAHDSGHNNMQINVISPLGQQHFPSGQRQQPNVPQRTNLAGSRKPPTKISPAHNLSPSSGPSSFSQRPAPSPPSQAQWTRRPFQPARIITTQKPRTDISDGNITPPQNAIDSSRSINQRPRQPSTSNRTPTRTSRPQQLGRTAQPPSLRGFTQPTQSPLVFAQTSSNFIDTGPTTISSNSLDNNSEIQPGSISGGSNSRPYSGSRDFRMTSQHGQVTYPTPPQFQQVTRPQASGFPPRQTGTSSSHTFKGQPFDPSRQRQNNRNPPSSIPTQSRPMSPSTSRQLSPSSRRQLTNNELPGSAPVSNTRTSGPRQTHSSQPLQPSHQGPTCRKRGERITPSTRSLPLCPAEVSNNEPCQRLDAPYDPTDTRPLCTESNVACRTPTDPFNPSDRRPLCPSPQRQPNCRQPSENSNPNDRRPLCQPQLQECRQPGDISDPLDTRPLCSERRINNANCRQPHERPTGRDTRPPCLPTSPINSPNHPRNSLPQTPQRNTHTGVSQPNQQRQNINIQNQGVSSPDGKVLNVPSGPQRSSIPSWQKPFRPQTTITNPNSMRTPARSPHSSPTLSRRPWNQTPSSQTGCVQNCPQNKNVDDNVENRITNQNGDDMNHSLSPERSNLGTPHSTRTDITQSQDVGNISQQNNGSPTGQERIKQQNEYQRSRTPNQMHQTTSRPSFVPGRQSSSPGRSPFQVQTQPLTPSVQQPSSPSQQQPSLPGRRTQQRNPPSINSPNRPAASAGNADGPRSLYEIVEDPSLLIQGRPVTLTKTFELFHKAGLDYILTDEGPYTVFLPSDDAFLQLPKGAIEQLEENPELLREVLLYHVIGSEVTPSRGSESFSVITLQGMPMIVTMLNGGRLILISGAKALAVTRASNGIFYVINKLLYPLPQENLYAALRSRPDLTQLTYLIETSGLVDLLQGNQPFTLFAPTNDAFAQVPEIMLQELADNETLLRNLLLGHMTEGGHYGREFLTGATYPSARGNQLRVSVVSYGYKVNDANIKTPEIVTGTGVIHLIDQLLFSPEDLVFIETLQNSLDGPSDAASNIPRPANNSPPSRQNSFSGQVFPFTGYSALSPGQAEVPTGLTAPNSRTRTSGQRPGLQRPSSPNQRTSGHTGQTTGSVTPNQRPPGSSASRGQTNSRNPANSNTEQGTFNLDHGRSSTSHSQRNPNIPTISEPGPSTISYEQDFSTENMNQPQRRPWNSNLRGTGRTSNQNQRNLNAPTVPESGPSSAAYGQRGSTGNIKQPQRQTWSSGSRGSYLGQNMPPSSQGQESLPQIAQVASSHGLNRFASLVTNTKLYEKIQDGGTYTIFAPTDNALESLPQNMLRSLETDPNQALNLLQYHIVPQKLNPGSLGNDETSSTLLQGKKIRFNVYNNGQVVTAGGVPLGDSQESGSTSVQLIPIDRVLEPPSGDLLAMIEAYPDLSEFATAVRAARLTWTLSAMGPLTLFAPSNRAFESLTPEQKKNLLTDKQMFTNLLKSHLVRGTIFASGLEEGKELRTENGKVLMSSVSENGVAVNSIPVTYTDIAASNGVLHVVDHFL